MREPNFILLYVQSPADSARFYADLLGKAPVEASPTFAMFVLDSGLHFGVWSKYMVEPKVPVSGCGGELAFALADDVAVNAMYATWCGRGLDIAQAPVRMDFGYTFVALDPDGHRLRVFAPAMR